MAFTKILSVVDMSVAWLRSRASATSPSTVERPNFEDDASSMWTPSGASELVPCYAGPQSLSGVCENLKQPAIGGRLRHDEPDVPLPLRATQPPEPTRPSSQAIALGLVLSVVAWFRLDPLTRGTLWAEDGVIFLVQRESLGPWRSVIEVYAGYLHVVPRLLTNIATLAPVEHYAIVVTALCCLVTGAIGGLVYGCTSGVIGSRFVRVAVASTTVLIPIGPIEVMGNMANLHWYFLWLTPWLLLAQPSKRHQSAGIGVVALLAGLTEIQAAIFLPLALARRKDRRSWPASCGLAVGVAIQIFASLAHPRTLGTSEPHGFLDITTGFILNAVVRIWNPALSGAGDIVTAHGGALVLLVTLPFLLAGLCLRPLLVLGTLMVGAIVPFVAAMMMNRSSSLAYDSYTLVELSGLPPVRYGVVPAMFLVAMVLCWIGLWEAHPDRWRAIVARTALVAVMALQISHLQLDETRRSDGPGWSGGIERARQTCQESRSPAPIPAAPDPRWAVSLRCDQLS